MTRSWLVTGAGGALGSAVRAVLEERTVTHPGDDVVRAPAHGELDLLDETALRRALRGVDVVVNCAAWTDVDRAETEEEAATLVNGYAVAGLARGCAASGARLLHVSTDYVFAGTATTACAEDAPTAPVNAYGRSKLLGEQSVRAEHPDGGYVVRTAWLYGARGRNFVDTILGLAAERESVSVVDDQHGAPTNADDLARRLVDLARSPAAPAGTYHATNAGTTTWYGVAREAYALAGLDPDRVLPTTSSAFPRPAPRPAYSVLGHAGWARAGLPPMRDWRDALADFVRLRTDMRPVRP